MHRSGARRRGPRGGLGAAALAAAATLAPASAPAGTLGMTADRITRSVTVFDADTHEVIGALALPDQDGATVGDCTISRDNRLGFVTDFKHRVWVIDLHTASLADGINPIAITTPGNDIAITPNGRHLLACDGEAAWPISVVDLDTRVEIGTFDLGQDCTSIEVCNDGSVLATTSRFDPNGYSVRRLTIDRSGSLEDTGEIHTWLSAPVNAYCPADSRTAVVLGGAFPEFGFRSLGIPGLHMIEWKQFGALYTSGVFGPLDETLYLRANSRLEAWAYDPAAGTLSPDPLYSRSVDGAVVYYGMEQIALHPDGHALYLGQRGRIEVVDPATGTATASITDPAIDRPSGICVQDALAAAIDVRPGNPHNFVWPGSPMRIAVAVLGSAGLDADEIDPTTLRFGPERGAPAQPAPSAIRDVNEDGRLDLIASFRVDASGIESGDTEACVDGRTHAGAKLRGCDAIATLPPCGNGFQLALVTPALGWLWRGRRREDF